MVTWRKTPVSVSTLPPFPEGWYFIATRQAVLKAGLIQKTWMGTKVVVWRDGSGRVCVTESVCPHLGSDLGPDAGGCVRDGRLVCPFHGYEFDTTGQCVATPYAEAPRTAKLRVFETRDINGMVFAWWGIGGREPQWGLHEDFSEQVGWSDFEISTLRFPGHPQETTENSVDIAHLRFVHGYDNVDPVQEVSVNGPLLETRFDFKRARSIAGVASFTFDVSAHARIYGLGYSYVEIREHSIGMDLRLWVLATPVDGALIDMTLVSQVREIRKPRRRIIGLGLLPVSWRARIMNRFIASQQRDDVLQDVVIWSRKQYVSRPRLCRSDGKIMPFRYYCAQFYPDPREDESTPPPPLQSTFRGSTAPFEPTTAVRS